MLIMQAVHSALSLPSKLAEILLPDRHPLSPLMLLMACQTLLSTIADTGTIP